MQTPLTGGIAEFAGLEIAGLVTDGRDRMGGHFETGN